MVSVIIPAHNEERVIGRCLSTIFQGAGAEELDVIVVCNGCRDRTAEVARGFGPQVRVIETGVASKTHALNLGDAAARAYPRFVVDADVLVPVAAIRLMANVLEGGEVLAVAPRFRMNLTGCGWAVRAFYDINGRLPSAREGIGGSGVYGLSRAGRERFVEFPDVIADDAFVRVQFGPGERRTLASCHSTVFAPRTLRDLVAIKTRSHVGNKQVRKVVPQQWSHGGGGNGRALLGLCVRPWMWARLGVYGYVKVAARVRGRRQLRSSSRPAWERDETSRGAVGEAAEPAGVES
jgi:glycosyltransferase involved in cell wall biosynthesis